MNIVIVFVLLIAFYLLLMRKAGKTFPILYLFLFTYFIQYVFSTYLIYNEYDVLSYQMPIGQEQYFGYVVPALIFLFAGVFVFNKDLPVAHLVSRISPSEASKIAYLLMAISYSFDIISALGIGAIASIISFTTYLKYVAAFCFLFSDTKWKYVWIALIYVQLMALVLATGVFISFFIWATFLFFFIFIKFGFPFWVRATFFIPFIPLLILIQSVKKEYRQATWEGKREGGLELLKNLANEKQEKKPDQPFAQSEGVIRTVGRLSQGWHLGLTLRRVPKRQPFVYGREMLSDIASSLLPRVIFANKKSVNSQDKFYRYTGHRLLGATSMSIGVLGDFYINYGVWGSYFMLFIFGALIAKMIRFFIVRYVLPYPLNFVWIPFLLSYLVRANNDFYMFFNCLVKGFLIFLAVNFLRKQLTAKKRALRPTRSAVVPGSVS